MATNLGVWELIRAKEVRAEYCTQWAREFLAHLTREQLLNRETIRQLAFFAKIKATRDLLPSRVKYDGENPTIGINHLYSEKALWSAGPDLAADVLNGWVPEVLRGLPPCS